MDYQKQILDTDYSKQHAISRTFTGRVLAYMSAAIAISGVIAYLFGTDADMITYMVNLETGSFTGLAWFATLAPFGLVLLMGARFNKLSATNMLLLFIAFAVLMGLSLSTIFLDYSLGSSYITFFVTSITFGIKAT